VLRTCTINGLGYLEQGREVDYAGAHKHLIPKDKYVETPEKSLNQVIKEHTDKFMIGAKVIEKASDVEAGADVFTEIKRFADKTEEPKVIKKKGK